MGMTKTIERIAKADTLPITEDALFNTFKAALTADDPLTDHIGRHFTGFFEGFQMGMMRLSDDSQDSWENVWKMIGVETPPMTLPPDCKFDFITLGRKNNDTVLEFKDASRSPSGIKMNWNYACVPNNGKHTERTQYHITILPKTPVENNLNRLAVAGGGKIIRPEMV